MLKKVNERKVLRDYESTQLKKASLDVALKTARWALQYLCNLF